MRLMEREDFRMKENKMSRRSFLKAGAFASAAGMLAAAPAAANAAAPNAAMWNSSPTAATVSYTHLTLPTTSRV